MKLLVSVINKEEAREAIKGGCDIVDVKNPREGSLGANFPWVIKQIKEIVPFGIEISVAIGDMPNLPGTASLAALGVAILNPHYIKIGLKGPKIEKEAVYLMKNVTKTVKEVNEKIKTVAAGYADYQRIGSINPLRIPRITHKSGADVAMIDVAIKDGKRLFDFLEIEKLRKFVKVSHKLGLTAALAGSLKKEDIEPIHEIGADVFGVRGAACSKGDRIKGQVKSYLVRELAEEVRR